MPDEYRCFYSWNEASAFHMNGVPRTDLQRMSTAGASAVLAAMTTTPSMAASGASAAPARGGLLRTPSQSRRAPTPQPLMSVTPESPMLDHAANAPPSSRTPSPTAAQLQSQLQSQQQPRVLTPKPELPPAVAEAIRTFPNVDEMNTDSAVREHEKFLLSRQKQNSSSVHGKRKQAGQESARPRNSSAKKLLPPPQPPVVAPALATIVVKSEPAPRTTPSAIIPAKQAAGSLLSKEQQKEAEATLAMLTASDAVTVDSKGQPTMPLGSVLQNLWASSSQFMTSQLNMVLQSTTAICIGALAFDKQRHMVAVPGITSTYHVAGGSGKPKKSETKQAGLPASLSPPLDDAIMSDMASDPAVGTDGDDLLAQQQQQQLTWMRPNERYGFVYGFYPGSGMLDGNTATARKPNKQGIKASDVAKFRGTYAGTYLQALLTATLAGLRTHRTGRSFTILCAYQPFVDMMTRDWKAWQELLTPEPPAHLAYLAPLTSLLTQLQMETTDRRASFEFREERMESLDQVMQVLREMSPVPPPVAHVPATLRASSRPATATGATATTSALRRTTSEVSNGSKFTDLSALWQNSMSNQLHHCFVYDERSLDITSDATTGEAVLTDTSFIVEPRWWDAMKRSIATPLLVVSPVEHSVVRMRWMFDIEAPPADSGDRDEAYVLRSEHARADFVPTTEEDRLLVSYAKQRESGLVVDQPERQRQLVVFTRDVWIPEVNFGRDRVAREQTRLRYGCYLWALICVLQKCPTSVTKLRIRLQSRVLLEHAPALAQSMLSTKLDQVDYQKHTHWLWARLRVLLSNRKVELREDSLPVVTPSAPAIPSPTSMDHVQYDTIASACQATRTSLTVVQV
jgi:hypothetical protein